MASRSAALKRDGPTPLDGRHGFMLLQERWVAFILDALAGGALGFNELSRVATCLSPATLSQRLGLLETKGLVAKTVLSTMPPRVSYGLTSAGAALLPVLNDVKAWAIKHLPPPED